MRYDINAIWHDSPLMSDIFRVLYGAVFPIGSVRLSAPHRTAPQDFCPLEDRTAPQDFCPLEDRTAPHRRFDDIGKPHRTAP